MIGEIPEPVLKALLETIPLEISVVDADDKVLAWNKHETRVFKRPVAAVGREVRKCHPEKSLAAVEKIISEMKAGTRERATFWIETTMHGKIQPTKLLIEYYALRDAFRQVYRLPGDRPGYHRDPEIDRGEKAGRLTQRPERPSAGAGVSL